MSAPASVLFVCVHNAGRSQMAAGFLRALGGDAVEVRSAGSAPKDSINPVAVEAMLERGIDLRAEQPKVLTDAAVQASDVVITMGCGDACPVYPGKRYEDWALDDPAGQGIEAVRPIRDEIERRVRDLLTSLDVEVGGMSGGRLKIVVVGSVAAGTSAAAKARRGSEDAEIVVYERDHDISYSGCGLPYYLGGEVGTIDELTPRDAAWFARRYGIEVRTGHEVTGVDPGARTVAVRDLATGRTFTDDYDELVLATGVSPVVPPLPGIDADGVFTLRNPSDARSVRAWVEARGADRAVVVGAGYIGLETAEQLTGRGIDVTLVEMAEHAMPRLDADVAGLVDAELRAHGVELLTRARVTAIETDDDGAARAVRVTSGAPGSGSGGADRVVETPLVIVAVGVRPTLDLAHAAGAAVGKTGAIAVDRQGRTDVDHVWAVGDVAESYDLLTGEPAWVPLGSTANKTGRIAGDALTGGDLEHRGILGTSIVRVFGLAVAQTGLTEDRARDAGFDPVVVHNIKPDRPTYLGGQEMLVKAVADRGTGRLLGAQAVGPSGVDKRIDVLATAITFGARAEDLFHLDLAYAPTYATTKDPVHYTGMALDGAISGRAPLISPTELERRRDDGETIQVVDVRSAKDRAKSAVDGSVHIPLAELRARAGELDPTLPTVTYCNKGVSGNAGQNVLRHLGFGDVANLSGGNTTYQRHKRSRDL